MDEEIRKKILALLDQHRIMTIATLRPDGCRKPRPSATSTKASLCSHNDSCVDGAPIGPILHVV